MNALQNGSPGHIVHPHAHGYYGRMASAAARHFEREPEPSIWQRAQARQGWLLGRTLVRTELEHQRRAHGLGAIHATAQRWDLLAPGTMPTPARHAAQQTRLVTVMNVLTEAVGRGHADDEPELGPHPVIASLSVGATRRFRLRRRDDHARTIDLEIASGCLLVMRGASQALCDHTVPRMRAVTEERINLTFRRVASSLQ